MSTEGSAEPVWHGEFRDERVVAVYDVDCPWSYQDDLFVALVAEVGGHRVGDVGCGTGKVTLALAARGYEVTGVDPAAASLALARSKPGAEGVDWREGSAEALPTEAFDIVIMTSHVAQFMITDTDFGTALADIARALVPGSHMIFDSRDPQGRAWERWNAAAERELTLPDGSRVRLSGRTTHRGDGIVDGVGHYAFDDGTRVTVNATMRFRPEAQLRADLDHAGFDVETIYGGWAREPVGAADREFIVVARRR